MTDWILVEDEPLPEGELVIVDMGFMGNCLRERQGDEYYDEHGNYDDSGEVPVKWKRIDE